MVDEAHITTFAVDPRYRRRRIGERLLLSLLDLSVDRHAREATLEVRLSNLAARRLYEKYGFRPVGIRPRYYSDNQEDALIMTTEPLASPAMGERIARLRVALDESPPPDAIPDAAGTVLEPAEPAQQAPSGDDASPGGAG
jgi:ribosomal-protein-alanine N-acetyltransferase